MQGHLDKFLFRNFPLLYQHRDDPNESLMCFGFACHDGWFGLLFDLSDKLETAIRRLPKTDVCRNADGCTHAKHVGTCGVEGCECRWDSEPPFAFQVKEKFGGLRFYMTWENEEMRKLIGAAEKLSYQTCDVCGEPGELRDDRPWIRTLCDEHYKEGRGLMAYNGDRIGDWKFSVFEHPKHSTVNIDNGKQDVWMNLNSYDGVDDLEITNYNSDTSQTTFIPMEVVAEFMRTLGYRVEKPE